MYCVRSLSVCLCLKMKSRSTHKYYCVHFVLFFLVVLIELCYLTAALTIPDRAQQGISLIAIPQRKVDFETDKSVDQADKPKTFEAASEVLDVKLTNDLNLIGIDDDDDDDDGVTRIISLNGVEVDSSQDRLLYALLPPVGDKLIDQPTPPQPQTEPTRSTTNRPRWRSTTVNVQDNESGASGRTVNNPNRTNSSTTINYDDYTVDKSETETALVGEVEEEDKKSEGHLRNCILGTSDVYLAWWINNDGSLRKSVSSEYENGRE